MIHSTQAEECPKCGGTELGKGRQSGQGSMFPYLIRMQPLMC